MVKSDEMLPSGNNQSSINNTETKIVDGCRFVVPKISCKRHGIHEHAITSAIKGHEGKWYMICALEALERVGVEKVEEINE